MREVNKIGKKSHLKDLIPYIFPILSSIGIIKISGLVEGRPFWYSVAILIPLIVILISIFFISKEGKASKFLTIIFVISLIILLIAIAKPPPTEQERITQLINNEAEWTKQEDIEKIMTLFDNKAYVTDVHNEKTWNGSDSIRQRYEWIFTHQDFEYLRHVDIKIAIKENDALVTCSTEGLYKENGTENYIHTGKDSERWILKQIDGNWKVMIFVCNSS